MDLSQFWRVTLSSIKVVSFSIIYHFIFIVLLTVRACMVCFVQSHMFICVFGYNVLPNIKHRLTIPVSLLEASWARRLPAQAHWHRAAAATVTVGVLWRVLRHGDIEGGVTVIDSVALGVHQRVTQEVIGHRCLCWRRNDRKWHHLNHLGNVDFSIFEQYWHYYFCVCVCVFFLNKSRQCL